MVLVTQTGIIMEERMSTTGTTSKNVLNSDVEIKDNLKFSGELTLEGKLEGEVQTDGLLNLGDTAVVNGNISSNENIEIKAKAELVGDIRATKLVVEEGVTFVGKTEVNPNKVTPIPAPPVRPGEAPKLPESGKPPGR